MTLWPNEMRRRARGQGDKAKDHELPNDSRLPAATLKIVRPQPNRRSDVRLAVPMPPLFGTIVSFTCVTFGKSKLRSSR